VLILLFHLHNSDLIVAQEIDFNYFEPNHGYMSADSFHHSVEEEMKKKGNIYDFTELCSAITNARSKVNLVEMSCRDFYN